MNDEQPKMRPPSLAQSGRGLYIDRTIKRAADLDSALLSVRGQPAHFHPELYPKPKTLWTPLYPHGGGPAQGFRCNYNSTQIMATGAAYPTCGRVTRTERGMKSHLWSVHRIKQQGELKFG